MVIPCFVFCCRYGAAKAASLCSTFLASRSGSKKEPIRKHNLKKRTTRRFHGVGMYSKSTFPLQFCNCKIPKIVFWFLFPAQNVGMSIVPWSAPLDISASVAKRRTPHLTHGLCLIHAEKSVARICCLSADIPVSSCAIQVPARHVLRWCKSHATVRSRLHRHDAVASSSGLVDRNASGLWLVVITSAQSLAMKVGWSLPGVWSDLPHVCVISLTGDCPPCAERSMQPCMCGREIVMRPCASPDWHCQQVG